MRGGLDFSYAHASCRVLLEQLEAGTNGPCLRRFPVPDEGAELLASEGAPERVALNGWFLVGLFICSATIAVG